MAWDILATVGVSLFTSAHDGRIFRAIWAPRGLRSLVGAQCTLPCGRAPLRGGDGRGASKRPSAPRTSARRRASRGVRAPNTPRDVSFVRNRVAGRPPSAPVPRPRSDGSRTNCGQLFTAFGDDEPMGRRSSVRSMPRSPNAAQGRPASNPRGRQGVPLPGASDHPAVTADPWPPRAMVSRGRESLAFGQPRSGSSYPGASPAAGLSPQHRPRGTHATTRGPSGSGKAARARLTCAAKSPGRGGTLTGS
jgi:hypothetical protein